MAEWLVEEGIAEHRAVVFEAGNITAARVDWPGRVAAGWVIDARLASRSAGSQRGTAVTATGEELLVGRLPRDACEGAVMRLAITRAAIAGPGRLKRAQARPTEVELAEPSLADRLRASGEAVRVVRRLEGSDWDDLIDEALATETSFVGGSLLFAPTAAMITIDVDGDLPPEALGRAAVPALATAISRFDLAGSIVVDFPTLATKEARRALDDALAHALAHWPHERTAMNGFGLVQIVARLERPSLLHLAAWQRAGLVWRRLLRRAESLEGPGSVQLAIHPRLQGAIDPAHVRDLERRTGKRVEVSTVATLALDAPHAQLVQHD